MPTNVEIKAKAPDLNNLRRLVSEISSSPAVEMDQDDTFFSVSSGRLKLRISSVSQAQLIYYHRHDSPLPKKSYYIVSEVHDPSSMRALLTESLGIIGRVRKHRTLYKIKNTRVHLDEIEGLGTYIELEVVLARGGLVEEGRLVALDLMSRLGIDVASLVSGAYLDLIRSSRQGGET